MSHYRAFQVDAFTRRRFSGNPAGVVLEADGLSDAQMQAIAREFNNSETAFLLKPDDDDHALRIRFFTPSQEVPSCGHATIASHFIRARLLDLGSARVWHKIGIGVLPVDIEVRDGGHRVIMTQGRPRIRPPVEGAVVKQLAEALGLSLDEIDPDCPVQWVDTGNSKLIVGVNTRNILDSIVPDNAALIAIAKKAQNAGVFVFTRDTSEEGLTAHARMFAPNIGIPEDPVTGNGNGPLGVYLVHNRLVPLDGDEVYLRTRQGEAMGRPGEAHVWVKVKDGEVETVRVGGDCAIAFETEIEV